MTEITRRSISHFEGSWASGLATLVYEDGSSDFCDNGPLVRALDGITGGEFIAAGHTVNNDAINGLDVITLPDEFGLCLGGLIPYEDWLAAGFDELIPGITYVVNDETGEVTELSAV